jgi:hypothetical protein
LRSGGDVGGGDDLTNGSCELWNNAASQQRGAATSNCQDLWMKILCCYRDGSFDEFACLKLAPAPTKATRWGCVDRAPAGLSSLDELERHATPAAREPGPGSDRTATTNSHSDRQGRPAPRALGKYRPGWIATAAIQAPEVNGAGADGVFLRCKDHDVVEGSNNG